MEPLIIAMNISLKAWILPCIVVYTANTNKAPILSHTEALGCRASSKFPSSSVQYILFMPCTSSDILHET